MSEYLIIILCIIVAPFILSLFPVFGFYKRFWPLLNSILIVGSGFIFWDILVTRRGHWRFNQIFVSQIRFFGLPLEEILFFMVVPFACIFLYEGMLLCWKDKKLYYNKWIYYLSAVFMAALALLSLPREYTSIVLFAAALICFLGGNYFKPMFELKVYWLWMIICFFLFVIFNYYLTALPIVIYNPEAILGIRIFTIPIEDFIYNFALLSFYLGIYLKFKKRID